MMQKKSIKLYLSANKVASDKTLFACLRANIVRFFIYNDKSRKINIERKKNIFDEYKNLRNLGKEIVIS